MFIHGINVFALFLFSSAVGVHFDCCVFIRNSQQCSWRNAHKLLMIRSILIISRSKNDFSNSVTLLKSFIKWKKLLSGKRYLQCRFGALHCRVYGGDRDWLSLSAKFTAHQRLRPNVPVNMQVNMEVNRGEGSHNAGERYASCTRPSALSQDLLNGSPLKLWTKPH